DAENRLLSVTQGSSSQLYTYDALGQRVSAIRDGITSNYINDPSGLGAMVAEYSGSNQLKARYNYGLALVSRVDTNGAADYYTFDAIGNARELVGPGGTILNRYDYTPFGQNLLVQGTVPNPFQFVGELGVISETNGTDFMRARYYDALSGRFVSRDPLGLL